MQRVHLSQRQLIGISTLSLLAIHAKPGYLVFILLFALLHLSQFSNKKSYIWWLTITLALHGIVLWFTSSIATVSGYYDGFYQNISAGPQLMHILQHPLLFSSYIFTNIGYYGWMYVQQMIGYFGWLTVALDPGVTIIGGTLLLWLLLQWKEPVVFSQRQRIVIFLTSLLGFLSLFTIAYLVWTPYLDIKICCLQGRYFIPYFWLLFLAIWQIIPSRKAQISMYVLILGLLIFNTIQSLFQGHY